MSSHRIFQCPTHDANEYKNCADESNPVNSVDEQKTNHCDKNCQAYNNWPETTLGQVNVGLVAFSIFCFLIYQRRRRQFVFSKTCILKRSIHKFSLSFEDVYDLPGHCEYIYDSYLTIRITGIGLSCKRLGEFLQQTGFSFCST